MCRDDSESQDYYEDLLTRQYSPYVSCACGWTGVYEDLEEDPFWDGECEIVIYRCPECGGEVDCIEA